MAIAGAAHPQARVTDWVKHGLIGGIVAGIAFAMFEMVMAASLNGTVLGIYLNAASRTSA